MPSFAPPATNLQSSQVDVSEPPSPHRDTARPAAPERMLLQWHVTERCNLRCTHCYQEDYAPHGPWEQLLATLERLEAFLAACRARRHGLPFRAH